MDHQRREQLDKQIKQANDLVADWVKHLNTNNTPTNPRPPEPLPPDIAAARKSRIDNDFITLFKRPCPPNTQPTTQGIGLYTHVQGPVKTPQFPHERFLTSDPVFLPIGGARRVGQGIRRDPLLDSAVREAWKEVKEAIDEEERIANSNEMTAEEIKGRYGEIDVPKRPLFISQIQQLQLHDQDALMQDAIANQTTPITPGVDGRRLSLGDAVRRESATETDVPMGGTDPATRGSLPRRGNIYHENRDPRVQRR